jgi:hypothetical protein
MLVVAWLPVACCARLHSAGPRIRRYGTGRRRHAGGGVRVLDESSIWRASAEEREFFVSGTAASYRRRRHSTDGLWNNVTRPATRTYDSLSDGKPDPRFNGTVIVEWLNVSGGVDAGPDCGPGAQRADADGAWVGVSAQWQGVRRQGLTAPSAIGPRAAFAPRDSFS